MKNVSPTKTLFKMAGLFVLVAVLVSWQPGVRDKAKDNEREPAHADTSAPKPGHIDQIDLQLNLDSVMQQVNIALANIDYNKINSDIQKAMSQIDYNKINSEINAAMKNIDWSEMKLNIAHSLDSAKMAIDKIDWSKMNADIAKAQAEIKLQMARQKVDMKAVQANVQKALQNAQKSIQQAKIEYQNYHGLINDLQRDGLIDTGKAYKVQLKDGDLYLNGVKQSKATTEKYKKYYSNKKNFSIGDNDGDNDKEADL